MGRFVTIIGKCHVYWNPSREQWQVLYYRKSGSWSSRDFFTWELTFATIYIHNRNLD